MPPGPLAFIRLAALTATAFGMGEIDDPRTGLFNFCLFMTIQPTMAKAKDVRHIATLENPDLWLRRAAMITLSHGRLSSTKNISVRIVSAENWMYHMPPPVQPSRPRLSSYDLLLSPVDDDHAVDVSFDIRVSPAPVLFHHEHRLAVRGIVGTDNPQ
jgi:hypothetical protein